MFTKIVALFLSVFQALFFPITGVVATSQFTTAAWDQIPASHYSSADTALSDPNASVQAKSLMARLKSWYGEYTLSGQYVSPYEDYTQAQFLNDRGELDVRLTNELFALQKINGNKLPAVLGLDYTGVEMGAGWKDWVTQFALQWHKSGGIVTFCWHWRVPRDVSTDPSEWDNAPSDIYAEGTNFNLKKALSDKNSSEYAWLLKGIDRIAAQLSILQDAGLPVIWRPLHEASGGWFWWGTYGKDAYIELYKLLYNKLVNDYGIHNLIWTWNAQNPDWYPGEQFVDTLSDDPYMPNWLNFIDPARAIRFKYTRRASPNKMVLMSENDKLPDIGIMHEQETKWLMFCTWDREKLLKPDPNNQPYGYLREVSEEYDSYERMYEVYNDARVLTLDEIV